MAKKHNLGIATDWTAVEQSVLEAMISAFASESNIIWYAKIAMQLQSEMEWDAALRCRWMSRKENSMKIGKKWPLCAQHAYGGL